MSTPTPARAATTTEEIVSVLSAHAHCAPQPADDGTYRATCGSPLPAAYPDSGAGAFTRAHQAEVLAATTLPVLERTAKSTALSEWADASERMHHELAPTTPEWLFAAARTRAAQYVEIEGDTETAGPTA